MTRTYPSGYELQYAYTDNGYAEKITGDGLTLWKCNDMNVLGQIVSFP